MGINLLVLEALTNLNTIDSLSLAKKQKTNQLQSAANVNSVGIGKPISFQKKIKDIKTNMMRR